MPALRISSLIARILLAGLLAVALGPARAEGAAFDLVGPSLRVTVTRGGTSLPLSQVPDLMPGDRLRVAAQLPGDQSAHYLLVLAFLRGATNPPPDEWLLRAQTWKGRAIDAAVPAGAEQAVLFLVPDTGGAFGAVRAAVRGRPGAFVRASQELHQAMLDRARLDAFLEGVKRSNALAPDQLAKVSPPLARSLAIKLDASCLLRQPEAQAACLTQQTDALVLADTQTSSIADTLAGAPADLALQLSATPQGGYGYYSPYIGVIRDVARILGAFQSAQLQYIPALSVQRDEATALLLNAVPSFRKPQSVLVAALPRVGPSQPPPLQAADPEAALCASRPGLVLPVTGAPLVYATDYARAMMLRVRTADGRTLDLPVRAQAEEGGYAVVGDGLGAADLGEGAAGELHGLWGFQPFDGPRFRLVTPRGHAWQVADKGSLVVGRETPLALSGGPAACVSGVSVDVAGTERPVTWEPHGADGLSLKVPLAGAEPGPVTLAIRLYGVAEPQRLTLQAYAEVSQIAGFTLHAGDRAGVLAGTRLDQVAGLDVGGISFRPGALSRVKAGDRLTLATDMAAIGELQPGQVRQAKVQLSDGRSIALKVTIAPARPAASLIGKTVEPAGPTAPVRIELGDNNLVPAGSRLTFSLRASGDTRFAGHDTVEVATDTGSASVSVPLRLQDQQVAVASVEPGAALGPSAYGPLRFRVVRDGVAGDWQPLATLVRLPVVSSVTCPAGITTCDLSGTGLFLLRSVAAGPGTAKRIAVPDGFTGTTLPVPRPTGGRLSVELRDAPAASAWLVFSG